MIAAIAHEDRIPDDRAVWREGPPPECVEGFRQVSVEYDDGMVERTFIDKAAWSRAKRWRFGWAPAW
jgi:hypothetical protein